MHETLPKDYALVGDDTGRRVEVHNVGSLLDKQLGTVVFGPYRFPYSVRLRAEKRKPGAKEFREERRTSALHYHVRMDRWRRDFTFLEGHLRLLETTAR